MCVCVCVEGERGGGDVCIVCGRGVSKCDYEYLRVCVCGWVRKGKWGRLNVVLLYLQLCRQKVRGGI